MLNQQKPEPVEAGTGATLDVVEIFYTLQGEGPFTGWPAIFVRLAGCNLQCPLCDTIYTGPLRRTRTLASIINSVQGLKDLNPGVKLVVLTGGEPLRQNITPFVLDVINEVGLQVQIESNGVTALPQGLHGEIGRGNLMLIVSPKTSKVHEVNGVLAYAYKYVLSHDDLRPEDGLPNKALGHKAKPYVARPPAGFKGPVFVNPCDDKDPVRNNLNLMATRDAALKFGYIAGIQQHKLLDLP